MPFGETLPYCFFGTIFACEAKVLILLLYRHVAYFCVYSKRKYFFMKLQTNGTAVFFAYSKRIPGS